MNTWDRNNPLSQMFYVMLQFCAVKFAPLDGNIASNNTASEQIESPRLNTITTCFGHTVILPLSADVNSQVTVLIKAFLRYKELKVLIDSIRRFYPKIKIIVADDSQNPEKVVGDNIEQYIMPPEQVQTSSFKMECC